MNGHVDPTADDARTLTCTWTLLGLVLLDGLLPGAEYATAVTWFALGALAVEIFHHRRAVNSPDPRR